MSRKWIRFLLKTVIKILLLSVLIHGMVILSEMGLIFNVAALGQMERSNEGYLLWNLFVNLRGYMYVICGFAASCLLCGIFADVYRFLKTNFKKIEKE